MKYCIGFVAGILATLLTIVILMPPVAAMIAMVILYAITGGRG
jgi:hypothetical protein